MILDLQAFETKQRRKLREAQWVKHGILSQWCISHSYMLLEPLILFLSSFRIPCVIAKILERLMRCFGEGYEELISSRLGVCSGEEYLFIS